MISRLARASKRLLLGAGIGIALTMATPLIASAHPLGNFTTNSFSGLQVEPSAVAIRMVVDFAEIPTVEQLPDANQAGGVPPAQAADYAAQECTKLLPGIRLTISGSRQRLAVKSSQLIFLNGAAGLHTMHLTCELRTTAPTATVGHHLGYVDENSLTRVGWREITAVGNGVHLAHSDAPVRSVSNELTHYPTALLSSPLDQRSASMQVVTGNGTVIPQQDGNSPTSASYSSAGLGGLTAAFTNLVSTQHLSLGFALLALLISVGLGALHAFAPGHGKTLMAAYLLGGRSSLRQVAVIGLTVTLTHTAGVLVLGLVLSAVVVTAPAAIYSWLGIASGAMLVAIGVSLLRRARERPDLPTTEARVEALVGAVQTSHHENVHGHDHGHDESHDHGHDHGHDESHDHGHDHPHDHPLHDEAQDLPENGLTHAHGFGRAHTHPIPAPATGARRMIAVGFAGGMVPSPSALIVLLGGIALGRTWFGVLLVVGYGLGMAVALTGTGVALAYARDHVERWSARRPARVGAPSALARALGLLPTLTATLVMVVGISVVVRAGLTL